MVTRRVAANGPTQGCEWARQRLKMPFFAYISENIWATVLKFGMQVALTVLLVRKNDDPPGGRWRAHPGPWMGPPRAKNAIFCLYLGNYDLLGGLEGPSD